MGNLAPLAAPELMELTGDSEPRVRLIGALCNACNASAFPARRACARCCSMDQVSTHLGPGARVHSFTRVQDPSSREESWLLMAQVKFEAGPIVRAYVEGSQDINLKLGMAVELVPRQLPELGELPAATTFAIRPAGGL